DNLIGAVDVYLVAHHANSDPSLPLFLESVQPTVAIADNGPWKGATPQALDALRAFGGLKGVWQLHRTINYGAENFPEAFIANVGFTEGEGGAWIKLSATVEGASSVTNGRTGTTAHYDAH